jgi:hypothetical protein
MEGRGHGAGAPIADVSAERSEAMSDATTGAAMMTALRPGKTGRDD